MPLDVDRLTGSTTWVLAGAVGQPPEIRPWLLMLWAVAWKQIPVATLPDDDDVVAALIGMPAAGFAVHKSVLLRGWKRHADGRLYHGYLTTVVVGMIRERDRFRERQRKHRETPPLQLADSPNVTRDAPVTHRASQADVNVKGVANTNSAGPLVDNSPNGATSWAQHWKAQGKALGMEAYPGEAEGDYCRRVARRVKGE